ncbi:integrin alpha-6-like [Aulostomus maculatus]
MPKFWHSVFLWVIWHFQTLKVAAFNLDTQNIIQRNGDQGSLFGFSVALHQQQNPTRKNLLLVGAPQSKHLHQVNVTGVVYQCDLTTASQRCRPIDFNNEEFLESKGIRGQWMGVRVTSQGPGQNVMMCAHRYQEWNPSPSLHIPRLVTGQCYLLGEDLQVGKEEMKRRRVVCDLEHLTRRPKSHAWFAYCQQGHGASFAKDNRSLIFGAPGAYLWKGIVRMDPIDNQGIFGEDPRETGNIETFDRELIPLQRDSYLGFSTDSGMALIKKGELTIVSGAPRGGYSGQVAFMKADPLAKKNLSVELVLSGPGLASSFGYDVAVVDFNGDGWDDLAVGAPQFFLPDRLLGGAVYIYINNKGRNWDKIDPIQLLGKKDSMFGHAVEYIGDINQDGNGDIAVGAPYDGSGQVYLFCGSSDGIHREHAQVISPGSKAVTLFGYSLSGNLDIDDNQYPDLAVGTLSDSVFVYRARPVVSVSTDLKITPNKIDVPEDGCDKSKCVFAVQVCFTYTAHPASFNPKLMLSLLNSSEPSRTSGGLPDISPVLDLYKQKRTVSEIVLIHKGCGSDNICQSNLQLQYMFCSRKTQNGHDVFKSMRREDGIAVITPSYEDIALEITVTNSGGDDAYQSHAVIRLPDVLHYTSFVSNTTPETEVACTANHKGTLIDCTLGNPLRRDAEIIFYVLLTTTGISLTTQVVNITLQLETTSVQTIQPVEAVAKVFFALELRLFGQAKPSQVSLSTDQKAERVIKSEDNVGIVVQFEFMITNLGRSLQSFANASLNIYWPKENSAGKWLLYLTQMSSKNLQPVPCSPVNEVNPIRLLKGLPSRRRRSEAVHEALSTKDFIFFTQKRKYKTLTCADGLKCVEISCPLVGLDSNAAIVLNSRLWNITFIEDYGSLNYLDVVVDAALSLKNTPENIGLKPEKPATKLKLTVFLERKTEYFSKVAWWIIFLTVIAGLLLLAALGFLLWKHGCINSCAPNEKFSSHRNTKTAYPKA